MRSLAIKRTGAFPIADLETSEWSQSSSVRVGTYWSGNEAPEFRRFDIKLLWADDAFVVRFDAKLGEPIIVTDQTKQSVKTIGLWERDVCEIFIAPDRNEPRRYFEFEIAPTGEWLDLAIDLTSGERLTDWEYRSGMEATARIEEVRVVMAMKIPWEAFGKKPKPGDVWLGNIFRCVGKEPDRGYLAWQPTKTATPNFHVPERFGEFVFEA